jgi:hypothetical protein
MSFDALSSLTQLESLQFKCCHRLNLIIQPLLNINNPLKIKTLVITDEMDRHEEILLLIQKIGSYIENLVLGIYKDDLRRKLFDTIIDFCEKIKFLSLYAIDFTNIAQLFKMIFNFGKYLKYLTLGIKLPDVITDKGCSISSIILKELSNILPLSLHYLDLNLIINPDDLKIALENFKQIELKKLLIRNWSYYDTVTTLKVIRDFIEENNFKYLEFLGYYVGNNSKLLSEEVESLEKLVEEIQLFIKIMECDDIAVKVSEIDGSLVIS